MPEPHVCCLCLTRDRPEFLKRAVACFQAQTYQNRSLLIWNTGMPIDYGIGIGYEIYVSNDAGKGHTIGWLRNAALTHISPLGHALIAHWDDDDWSCPTRLAEQVAFMESSGAPVVGYRDMPFYDEVHDRVTVYKSKRQFGYVLGTSLLYKREVWERTPFPDVMQEDTRWQMTVGAGNIKSQSSIDGPIKMFATIHKGNTSPKGRYPAASKEVGAAVREVLGVTV